MPTTPQQYQSLLDHTTLPYSGEERQQFQNRFDLFYHFFRDNYHRVFETPSTYSPYGKPRLRYTYLGPHSPRSPTLFAPVYYRHRFSRYLPSSWHIFGDEETPLVPMDTLSPVYGEWPSEHLIEYQGPLGPGQWLYANLNGHYVTAIYLPAEAVTLRLITDLEVDVDYFNVSQWGTQRQTASMDISVADYQLPCPPLPELLAQSRQLPGPFPEKGGYQPPSTLFVEGYLFRRYQLFAPYWPVNTCLQVDGSNRILLESFFKPFNSSWQPIPHLPTKVLSFQSPRGNNYLLGDLAAKAHPSPVAHNLKGPADSAVSLLHSYRGCIPTDSEPMLPRAVKGSPPPIRLPLEL